MNILQQIIDMVNCGNSIEQAVEMVVPGADVSFWRRLIERRLRQSASAPKRRQTGRPRKATRPSKRMNYAAGVLGRDRGQAMAELVERVNGHPDATAPQSERSILLTIGSEIHIMEVR